MWSVRAWVYVRVEETGSVNELACDRDDPDKEPAAEGGEARAAETGRER